MKIRLVVALVASSFASPILAQQTDKIDQEMAHQRNLLADTKALGEFGALGIKEEEALSKNDAGALAALFTEDAVLVAPDGLFFGREAIENRYVKLFQRWPTTSFAGQRDQLNGIDNAVWSTGKWWSTHQGENGPVFVRGYWSAIYVREGDDWKIRQLTITDAPTEVRAGTGVSVLGGDHPIVE
jgi:uncharacterized protein (TIGR02246 family)